MEKSQQSSSMLFFADKLLYFDALKYVADEIKLAEWARFEQKWSILPTLPKSLRLINVPT
jgi:hypothetical protein